MAVKASSAPATSPLSVTETQEIWVVKSMHGSGVRAGARTWGSSPNSFITQLSLEWYSTEVSLRRLLLMDLVKSTVTVIMKSHNNKNVININKKK